MRYLKFPRVTELYRNPCFYIILLQEFIFETPKALVSYPYIKAQSTNITIRKLYMCKNFQYIK